MSRITDQELSKWIKRAGPRRAPLQVAEFVMEELREASAKASDATEETLEELLGTLSVPTAPRYITDEIMRELRTRKTELPPVFTTAQLLFLAFLLGGIIVLPLGLTVLVAVDLSFPSPVVTNYFLTAWLDQLPAGTGWVILGVAVVVLTEEWLRYRWSLAVRKIPLRRGRSGR